MKTPSDLEIKKTNTLMAAVGNTPLLRLSRLTADLPPQVQVFAKAEWFNPGGSVKDRPAFGILQASLEAGALTEGRRLLDSTSGNMGIAYATLGAALGVPITLTIPANASPERLLILRALGAELILSDPLEGSDGAIELAQQLAETHLENYYYADQYSNPANWEAHYETTGPEIWRKTGAEITHFIAGLGTTGTLMGTGRYLRNQNPEIEIIGFQPDGPFHGLEGLKHMPSSLQPSIFDPDFPDRLLKVTTEDAYEMARQLAQKEGLFVGVSSGAAAHVAIKMAAKLKSGVVIILFPDAGYKYLSEAFWKVQT